MSLAKIGISFHLHCLVDNEYLVSRMINSGRARHTRTRGWGFPPWCLHSEVNGYMQGGGSIFCCHRKGLPQVNCFSNLRQRDRLTIGRHKRAGPLVLLLLRVV